VSLLQTFSHISTQSPPTFRHLSQPVTSLCMPASLPSADSSFNHAFPSSFTSLSLVKRLPTKKFLQRRAQLKNHLGPSLGYMLDCGPARALCANGLYFWDDIRIRPDIKLIVLRTFVTAWILPYRKHIARATY
jgi:hypothetical protein